MLYFSNLSYEITLFSGRYFDEISQDTGKYCFGVEDTLKALELGSVETLICWENLDIQRYVLKNHTTAEEKILHLTPEQEKDKTHFTERDVCIIDLNQLTTIMIIQII